MKPLEGRPLHIVCLHGTACNAEILKTQLRGLISDWDGVETTFIEGSRIMTNSLHPTVRLIRSVFSNGKPQALVHREYVETAPLDLEAKVYGNFDFAIAKFEEQLSALNKPVCVSRNTL